MCRSCEHAMNIEAISSPATAFPRSLIVGGVYSGVAGTFKFIERATFAMIATTTRPPWWAWPLLLVSLPLVAVALVLWFAAAMLLQVIVWIAWCSRGRYALVVYSNSPIWQGYFEQHVLPAVGRR